MSRFLSASLQPDLSLDFLRLTLKATLITLAFAVCGTTLSLIIGFIGGILISEIWWATVWPHRSQQTSVRLIWLGLRGMLAFPRAIHELIWGLFFVNIFGLDPLVGIVAIAVPYSAIVAKVFSEILDETPRQPLMALINSGVAPLTAFSYSLIPQALLNLLSYSFYRFECSLRSAAVLGIIGAGGLGYEIFLSLKSLRYQQLWTLFYALILLNGTVDLISALTRHRLGTPTRLTLNLRKPFPSPSSPPPTSPLSLPLSLLPFLLLIPLSFGFIDADFSQLWSPRTATLLQDIGQQTFPIRFTPAELPTLIRLSLQTLSMSLLAIAGAGVGGILLSFPAAHNLLRPGGLLRPANSGAISFGHTIWIGLLLISSRLILLVCRAIPAPIWALVVLFVLFPGVVPGAIALGLHNLGILGRLMAEGIENLDARPLKALSAQGTPAPLVFLYGVLPLCLPQFLAYILYRWEVCLRETVIVGLVGAGGLGRRLTEQLSSFDYSGVVVSLGCFVVLTFAVDALSGMMRRSLR